MRYEIDQYYFNEIDSEEKAYWIGFLWCDGYVCKRIRKNDRIEYNIKLSLMEEDSNHLYKFKKSLNSSHPIKLYNYGITAFNNKAKESRIFITNSYMGEVLQKKYGLIPHRFDCSIVINKIPRYLIRHFVRGILDADGCISIYKHNERPRFMIKFSTYEQLLPFIAQYFYKMGLTNRNNYKIVKRHKESNKDGYCRSLTYSGNLVVMKLLNHIYLDSNIYLDRKYNKFQETLTTYINDYGKRIEV